MTNGASSAVNIANLFRRDEIQSKSQKESHLGLPSFTVQIKLSYQDLLSFSGRNGDLV